MRWKSLSFALLLLLGLHACSNSDRSNDGVARVGDANVLSTLTESAIQPKTLDPQTTEPPSSGRNIDTSELTDEEITTLFTTCMRNHGFNIPDPVVNADGTVDQMALRASLGQDPKFQVSGKAREALGDCLPLLEGATFAKEPSPEDEIQLQDDMLKFAQCLRDKGIDVPDPDFSDNPDNPRAAMRPMVANLKGPKVGESVRECIGLVFRNSESEGDRR